MTIIREIKHAHFYCGLGGGKRGFNRGKARVGNLVAKFRCIGGIDSDPRAIEDFNHARNGEGAGTVMDLFSLEQYIAFHGKHPPAGWREMNVPDIHRAFNNERPNILFLSAPCKGFSGLLSEAKSKTGKYQALNQLTLRGVWLAMEAWKDDPAEFVLFENVPRIQNRGRALLDQIVGLLRSYGYATAETTHCCGELGGLAQTRKRFLLVARHVEKVPPFLYEPVKRPLRAVGEVLEKLRMPGDLVAGPMHRLPALQFKTWVRLAFVEPGSDWRSLQKLNVADGVLADFGLERELFRGAYGVKGWDEPAATVTSKNQPSSGAASVADPRVDQVAEYGQLGVRAWNKPIGAVSGQSTPGGGRYAVADPRFDADGNQHFNNVYRVVRWGKPAPRVTGGGSRPTSGGPAIADPRVGYGANSHRNKLVCVDWNKSARTITGANQVQGGALSVADPRCGDRDWRSGPYGVVPWTVPAGTVAANASADNSFSSVADPRMPEPSERIVCVIRAIDGTWHRPFTTLELAAIQTLIDPEEHLELAGLSDSAWRERIGNAVPPEAAEAIAGVIGTTLLLAWSGETFVLGATPIWVRDVAVALSVA